MDGGTLMNQCSHNIDLLQWMAGSAVQSIQGMTRNLAHPYPGVGGHCIPIDPFYLTHIARKYDYHTRLIEMAGEINDFMPEYVVQRLMKLLNRSQKCLNGAKIILLGIAYKGDIEDMRESPALKVLEHLEQEKASVQIVDPYIEEFQWNGQTIKTFPLSPSILSECDAVVITTAHIHKVDYPMVCRHAPLILDTKNILKETAKEGQAIVEVL